MSIYNEKGITVLSLFDGMSCGQIALQKLGIKVDKYYASEIKPHGIQVTQENFPNTIQLGDITKITYEDGYIKVFESREKMNEYFKGNAEIQFESHYLGEVDLFMGGSPCKQFSIACISDRRKGLEGDDSKLFYEYLRLLKEIQPKNFLLENVAGMKNSDRDSISEYLGVTHIRINSKLLTGALRDRYYWTNIEVNSELEDLKINVNNLLETGYYPNDKFPCLTESESRPNKIHVKQFHRYSTTGFKRFIFLSKKHFEDCSVHYNTYFKGSSAAEIDDKMKKNSIDVSVYDGIRVASSVEMERLQTVPEGYTKSLSRNDAASLLGDGWTIDVIAHILKHAKF